MVFGCFITNPICENSLGLAMRYDTHICQSEYWFVRAVEEKWRRLKFKRQWNEKSFIVSICNKSQELFDISRFVTLSHFYSHFFSSGLVQKSIISTHEIVPPKCMSVCKQCTTLNVQCIKEHPIHTTIAHTNTQASRTTRHYAILSFILSAAYQYIEQWYDYSRQHAIIWARPWMWMCACAREWYTCGCVRSFVGVYVSVESIVCF